MIKKHIVVSLLVALVCRSSFADFTTSYKGNLIVNNSNVINVMDHNVDVRVYNPTAPVRTFILGFDGVNMYYNNEGYVYLENTTPSDIYQVMYTLRGNTQKERLVYYPSPVILMSTDLVYFSGQAGHYDSDFIPKNQNEKIILDDLTIIDTKTDHELRCDMNNQVTAAYTNHILASCFEVIP